MMLIIIIHFYFLVPNNYVNAGIHNCFYYDINNIHNKDYATFPLNLLQTAPKINILHSIHIPCNYEYSSIFSNSGGAFYDHSNSFDFLPCLLHSQTLTNCCKIDLSSPQYNCYNSSLHSFTLTNVLFETDPTTQSFHFTSIYFTPLEVSTLLDHIDISEANCIDYYISKPDRISTLQLYSLINSPDFNSNEDSSRGNWDPDITYSYPDTIEIPYHINSITVTAHFFMTFKLLKVKILLQLVLIIQMQITHFK